VRRETEVSVSHVIFVTMEFLVKCMVWRLLGSFYFYIAY